MAPHEPVSKYRHNRTGDDNADAHMKRQIMGREVVVAITNGRLDFGPWEHIFYGEFDGRRRKRVLVKTIGDGPMYYAASIRNRDHLAEFESGNLLMHLKSKEHAEAIVRELAADWMARKCFFIGIFEKATGEWAGQVYVGPTNWELPEFTIGYIADVNHEGKGYISEAVTRVLEMLFRDMGRIGSRVTATKTTPAVGDFLSVADSGGEAAF